ncbi:MAG: hypothetical protein M1829_006044 [Trizodia sp. TS-e1964]|nr:MAG: hypothetical protein M1829_006044 [Trizodia sp. TS-e1964]
MADVRSLLRNERAARRITDPHAAYSTNNTLTCTVCHIQIKSEALWASHARSLQHTTRSGRAPASIPADKNKKRKAEEDDDDEDKDEGRKRSKTPNTPYAPLSPGSVPPITQRTEASQQEEEPGTLDGDGDAPAPAPPAQPTTAIDEAEWAAFQLDIATPQAAPTASSAIISAPALSAMELTLRAAVPTEEQRKERLEAEREAEREDAARRAEEERDEMESLDERVRRLNEKHSALQALREKAALAARVKAEVVGAVEGSESEDGDGDEGEDEDDWARWG